MWYIELKSLKGMYFNNLIFDRTPYRFSNNIFNSSCWIYMKSVIDLVMIRIMCRPFFDYT